jgi:hypothetical protein
MHRFVSDVATRKLEKVAVNLRPKGDDVPAARFLELCHVLRQPELVTVSEDIDANLKAADLVRNGPQNRV